MKRYFHIKLVLAWIALTMAITGGMIITWEWYLMKPFYAWVDARYLDIVENWRIKRLVEHAVITMSMAFIGVSLLLRLIDSKQRELSASEEKYRTLFENASDGIAIVDLKCGRIEKTNKKLMDVSGYVDSEIVGKSLADVLFIDTGEPGLTDLFNGQHREVGLIKKNGDITPVVVRFNAIEINSHKFLTTVVSDISDAQRLETEKEQIHRKLYHSAKLVSLGELSAGLAHEINNPLNSVINLAQLIIDDIDNNERDNLQQNKREMLESIIGESCRMAKIVQDLLTFAQQDAHERTAVHLGQIIEQSFSLFGHRLEKDAIQVFVDVEDAVPLVKAEASQLKQVLINFIINSHQALKVISRDARERIIRVSVSSAIQNGESKVVMNFYDNGIGIPRQDLDHVFDPFFTTKRDHGGTGLGLSISFGIIHDHGGTIRVTSQKGGYTCFTIELPACTETVALATA